MFQLRLFCTYLEVFNVFPSKVSEIDLRRQVLTDFFKKT